MVEACRALLGRFPADPEASALKKTDIPDMLYAEAEKTRTLSSYRKYLDSADPSHPKYRAVVKLVRGIEARDERAWKEAQRKNSLEAYRSYRTLNPEGAHTAEASSRVTSLTPPPTPALPRVDSGEPAGCTQELLQKCLEGPGGKYDPTNAYHRALVATCAAKCSHELLGR